MMKKNSTKGYLILGILFAVIGIIAFAVPTQKTETFWIVYAFTMVAFVAQIGIWKIALGKGETLKSKFLGFPVVHIGIVYLLVQVLAFAVFLFVPTAPVWIEVVVCVLIAGLSSVCIIATDTGKSEIERVEAKVQKKVFYIKSLQADVELLANQESDSETKAALTQLAGKIRFSDPMSHEQLEDLESKISAMVTELKTNTRRKELITKINFLLDTRNKKCEILR